MHWDNRFLEKSIAKMLDRVVIPEELRQRRGRMMLHVSDTPFAFYRCLERIIDILQPPCILHTGDFVDEIKLEQTKRDLGLYRQRVRVLVDILRGENGREVILVTGNHDLYEVVLEAATGCTVLDTRGTVAICGKHVNVGHSFSDLPEGPGSLNFYGHDTTPPPEDGDVMFFNGLLSMNLIDIHDEEVFSLRYPAYVQRERQCIRSMGL